MGNPHVTFFGVPLDRGGPARRRAVEHRPRCSRQGANVGIAQVLSDDGRIRLRVWERGAGLTLGLRLGRLRSALVNASRRGLTGRSATVLVDGGALDIMWRDDGHVEMTGPVAHAFEGVVRPRSFPSLTG